MHLLKPIPLPSFLQSKLLQTAFALLFYSCAILFNSNILELSPRQPLVPDFSLRGDKALTVSVLQWNIEGLNKTWDLGLTEAPIFYPEKNARFFSDHLFGHLIYAYPLSFFIESPVWLYNVTYQLNRLTIAMSAFLLCLWITSSVLPSLLSGGLLLSGWHFGQIANTGLGWSIFALLFFLMHLRDSRWIYAAGAAFFSIVAALCSGYLVFFTPIALLIVFAGHLLYVRRFPDRRWFLQIAVVLIVVAAALAPSMLLYKKIQQEHGLRRPGYSLAKFVLPSLHPGAAQEDVEPEGNERVFRLSRMAALQIFLTLCAVLLMLRKSFNFDGWQFSFALLAVLTFWMAEFAWSPYRLLSGLPGFNGLRAIQRWYLFWSVAMTVMSAMTLTHLYQTNPRVFRPVFLLVLLLWVNWMTALHRETFKPARIRPGYEAYTFLRTLPPGPICSLPVVDSSMRNWARVPGARMLYQLLHRFPMISGYSGFTPPLTVLMESAILQKGFTRGTANKLARTGVRYVVVDPMLGNTSNLRKTIRSMPGVEVLFESGDQMVARLAPAPVETRRNALISMWGKGLALPAAVAAVPERDEE